jgi:hypothetical protein
MMAGYPYLHVAAIATLRMRIAGMEINTVEYATINLATTLAVISYHG